MSRYYPTATSVRDRTVEFNSIVDSIRQRNGASSSAAAPQYSARHRLLEQPGLSSGATTPNSNKEKKKSPKGEFAQRAQGIANDIASTTEKLGKLAQRECLQAL